MSTALTPQQEALTRTNRSPFALYRELAVGSHASTLSLLWYELLMTGVSGLSGLLGLSARAVMYPTLLGSCGSRPGIGRGIAIRRPRQIHLGHKVLIDDYAVLDVRGDGSKITLEDYVSIGRFSTVSAKNGSIHLASGVNVGSYTRIATQSSVSVGESTLIAAYCYIGPGNHQSGDGPLISQPMDIRGGVQIGSHSWIGAHTTIMDGVTIGSNTIIGAHSLVRESIPDNSVAFGVPARVASREKASLSD